MIIKKIKNNEEIIFKWDRKYNRESVGKYIWKSW